ncbi:LA2681 family HEPN domain-containing protein [Thiobacillus sp.]|uniref:LA2681 family HEPN domain-containing protein n=1 Tax=Thiobacillus sp. TaxID=924 RepID=UPI0025DDF7E0|nr:LA2681 family HEPN domain-containing protein [Thiobacillus sp.]MBT9539832.1 hypothetical protein [Thiobacillus sp.]
MTDPLQELALAIDAACGRNDAASLRRALEIIAQFDYESLTLEEQATLDFYAANAYAGLRRTQKAHQDWAWAQPLLENEIHHLRLALNRLVSAPKGNIATDLKFRVTTNLANALNHAGRFVEAIELWDQAISEHPSFSMAIGNRALALYWYARYLNDGTTQDLFLKESYVSFRLAASIGVEGHAQPHIQAWVTHLGNAANWDTVNPKVPRFRKGTSKVERQYRNWCVQNRLVLSPVNDLSRDWVSLQDSLTLPAITFTAREASATLPEAYAIFNQLKQEYVSARYLVFEAIQEQSKPLHFADRGVVLYDALDYRYYRLWIEKLKMAFLSAHAIFDKIAYLINDYWKLELGVRGVNFNLIWYADTSKSKIADRFASSDNWPLRGLFWLSKDFSYKTKSDRAVVDPEAKILHEIRNHIAHKYLRVHDHTLYGTAEARARHGHDQSFPVSDLELKEQSIKLLKLVRSALIYLSAAVTHEENRKLEKLEPGLIGSMPITSVGDKYRL